MAKTKEQWYSLLSSWVPQWWFNQVQTQEAVMYGFAAVLERLDGDLQDHFTETFICLSKDGYMDEHGLERNLSRLNGELDPEFCQRIRNIVNSSNCPAIKQLVDALLDVGECTIIEDWQGGSFFSREAFFNRGFLLIDLIYNAFSIVVDLQVHAPYSFYSREYFMNREDFVGTNESSFELFERIVDAVNAAKALGTVYRLVERTA